MPQPIIRVLTGADTLIFSAISIFSVVYSGKSSLVFSNDFFFALHHYVIEKYIFRSFAISCGVRVSCSSNRYRFVSVVSHEFSICSRLFFLFDFRQQTIKLFIIFNKLADLIQCCFHSMFDIHTTEKRFIANNHHHQPCLAVLH